MLLRDGKKAQASSVSSKLNADSKLAVAAQRRGNAKSQRAGEEATHNPSKAKRTSMHVQADRFAPAEKGHTNMMCSAAAAQPQAYLCMVHKNSKQGQSRRKSPSERDTPSYGLIASAH